MNILFTCSDLYSKYAGILMTSIFENHIEETNKFHFYIMSVDIKEATKEILNDIAQKYGGKLDFVNVNIDDQNNFPILPSKWGIYTWMKLLAPKYINAKNILYLDSDIICCGNILDLESMNIDDCYIALAPDTNGGGEHKKRLGMEDNSYYGCAGVVYMNLEKLRNDKMVEKFISFIHDNKDKLLLADQDVLNYICNPHKKKLSIRFNLMDDFMYNTPLLLPEDMNDYYESMKDIRLVHFMGFIKPWHSNCKNPLRFLFWKYANRSPYHIDKTKNDVIKPIDKLKIGIKYVLQDLGIYQDYGIYISDRKLKKLMDSNKYELLKS